MKISTATAALSAAILSLLLIMPVPAHGREVAAALDLVHAPVFAVFAAVVSWAVTERFPRLGRLAPLVAWILAVGFGLVIEVAQGLSGRIPHWQDVLSNALGAAVGTLWVATGKTLTRR